MGGSSTSSQWVHKAILWGPSQPARRTTSHRIACHGCADNKKPRHRSAQRIQSELCAATRCCQGRPPRFTWAEGYLGENTHTYTHICEAWTHILDPPGQPAHGPREPADACICLQHNALSVLQISGKVAVAHFLGAEKYFAVKAYGLDPYGLDPGTGWNSKKQAAPDPWRTMSPALNNKSILCCRDLCRKSWICSCAYRNGPPRWPKSVPVHTAMALLGG